MPPRRPRSALLLAAAIALPFGAVPRDVAAHADIDEVVREIAAEARRHPEDPAVLLQHARVLESAGDFDAALAAYDHAAGHGADRDEVGVARGRVLLAAGRPVLAKRELDRVIARRRDAWGAYLERARVARALGRPATAAADFGRAIRGLPAPRPEIVLERRDALLAVGRLSHAIRALDDGLARTGPAASLELAALDLEESLGRWDDALRRLDRLLATGPPNPVWVARRGDVLARAGRTAEARAARERALAMLAERPVQRRGAPLADLEHRLRTALDSPETTRGETR